MVRAILAGNKTQTRRVVKLNRHYQIEERDDGSLWPWMYDDDRASDSWLACPYGMPGDCLWVRETWAVGHGYDGHKPSEIPALSYVRRHYAATEERGGLLWRPSIFMPRWASRITLEVTEVRVQRLQDISEADAMAEGVSQSGTGAAWASGKYDARSDPMRLFQPVALFERAWESINGPNSWDANPWVWAINFKRLA